MFSGIVQTTARIELSGGAAGGGARLRVRWRRPLPHPAALGDSIAVNGCCLTVAALAEDGFEADCSAETLACTALGRLPAGREVNLEEALRAASPLGGHLVSGHVDGVATVEARSERDQCLLLRLCAPRPLARYLARKGSVCLDGVSLTVNAVEDEHFEVNLIPHTLAVTSLGALAVGDPVNLEVDLVARYLERLLEARQ